MYVCVCVYVRVMCTSSNTGPALECAACVCARVATRAFAGGHPLTSSSLARCTSTLGMTELWNRAWLTSCWSMAAGSSPQMEVSIRRWGHKAQGSHAQARGQHSANTDTSAPTGRAVCRAVQCEREPRAIDGCHLKCSWSAGDLLRRMSDASALLYH